MLSHVIRQWLARMKDERELDVTLIAYLGLAGFHDVHLTHGPNELGKDFIARRVAGGNEIQFALQSKVWQHRHF